MHIIFNARRKGYPNSIKPNEQLLGLTYPVVGCARCGNFENCPCGAPNREGGLDLETRKHIAISSFFDSFEKLHVDTQKQTIALLIEAAATSKFLRYATDELFEYLFYKDFQQSADLKALRARFKNLKPSERGRTPLDKAYLQAIAFNIIVRLTSSPFDLPLYRNQEPSGKRDLRLNQSNACTIASSACTAAFPDYGSLFREKTIRKAWYARPSVGTAGI